MQSGYVYLIQDLDKENSYKIGYTTRDINKRMKELQTGTSSELYLVESYKTNYPSKIETMLHNFYNRSKIKNEWFSLTDDEVDNFLNKCKDYEDIISVLSDNPFFSV